MDYFHMMGDFQSVLFGAGCLALGYVYGRHCRLLSEMQTTGPTATEEACCPQSQSNTYLQEQGRCACCMSASAALDIMTMKISDSSCLKKSHLDDDAERGIEGSERCTRRDLGKLEACQMMLRKNSGDAVSGAQTPYKVWPVIYQSMEPAHRLAESHADKAEMSTARVGDGVGDGAGDAADPEPWSPEVFNQRIDYFNNVSSETHGPASIAETEEGSRIVRSSRKKKSPKVRSTTSEESTHYTSTDSRKSTFTLTRSSSGLGALLATPLWEQVNCYLDNTNYGDSLKKNDLTLGNVRDFPTETDFAPENVYLASPGPKDDLAEDITSHNFGDSDSTTRYELRQRTDNSIHDMELNQGNLIIPALEVPPFADDSDAELQGDLSMQAEMQRVTTSPAEAEDDVGDRCLQAGNEMKNLRVPADKVLKAEIYELLYDTDCGKVSFEEIVSLLEERLHVDLQENKAHIAALVREVICISKLLEGERAMEVDLDQETTNFNAPSLNC